jgi:hypothetical protein
MLKVELLKAELLKASPPVHCCVVCVGVRLVTDVIWSRDDIAELVGCKTKQSLLSSLVPETLAGNDAPERCT